jgi:hypothetical protein
LGASSVNQACFAIVSTSQAIQWFTIPLACKHA